MATMFAAQLLGPNVQPGPWAVGPTAIVVADWQVYAIGLVVFAALGCGVMAYATRHQYAAVGVGTLDGGIEISPEATRRIVAGLAIAAIGSVSWAEVPGLMCSWFLIVAPWLCWP